jgi:iron complex outermembrane receptor protein
MVALVARFVKQHCGPRLRLALTGLAVGLGGAGGAFGQQSPLPADPSHAQAGLASLQEIVVTAQRRTQNLQNVPLSVEALPAQQLRDRGITGVASLMSGDIPSVKVEPFAGNQSVLEVAIRGFLDPNGSDITNENPVPIYIDGVYYGRQIATALELNDLESIQVLRGPQGTLFGMNAEGGAVLLTSKQPTGKFDVNSSVEVGNFGYRKFVAHVDLPSIGGLATKIDLLGSSDNGWTTNPAPGQHNYGVTQSYGGKLTLLYKGERFSIENAADWTNLKTTEGWNAQLSTTDIYAAWPNQTSTPLSEPYQTQRPLDPQVYWGDRLTADFDLSSAVKLKSITAFRDDKATAYNTAQNSASLPGPILAESAALAYGLPPTTPCTALLQSSLLCSSVLTGIVPIYQFKYQTFSQELQLIGSTKRLNWVAGLFYLHEVGSQIENTYFGTLLPGALGPPPAFLPYNITASALLPLGAIPAGSSAGADILNRSYAAYGQATWRPPVLDDKLSLTAGVRLGRDEKTALRPALGGPVFTQITWPAFQGGPIAGGLPCPQSPQCAPSSSHGEISPLAAIAYQWTPNISSYLRFSTGYQASGLSVSSQLFKYTEPSKVHAYEFGLKSMLLGNRLRANLAVFYEDWQDPQENVQTVSASAVEFFSGRPIYISGAELDLNYRPVEKLELDGSLSLLHGVQGPMTNPFTPPPGSNQSAVQSPFHIVALPSWTASLAATYDIADTSYGDWRFSAQENGTSSYYTVPNAPAVGQYWLTDARLTLTDIPLGSGGGQNLELSIWGKNLTNRNYLTFLYETPGVFALSGPAYNVDSAYGMPRTYGATLTYRFE